MIDIGTNSTRLLVADVADGRVGRVERQSRVTRLGRGRRPLRAALRRGDRGGLRGDRRLRRDLPASRAPSEVDAIATSAVRDAANGDAFVAELRERFALSARVLDGEEEARLTYLGATAERPPDRADAGDRHRRRLDRADRRHRRARSPSTPRCRPASSATPSATSPPTRRPRSSSRRSPPTSAALIEAAVADRPERGPAEAGIAVAGTPTSLAAVELGLEPYDPDARPRPRPLPAVDPAPALAARLGPAGRAGRRSPACTPTGRRRSSPAS